MKSCLDCGDLYSHPGYRCVRCARVVNRTRHDPRYDEAWYRALTPRGVCYLCRAAPATTRDHVVPLNRGGEHSPANIKFSCGPCNSRKRDNLLEEN